MDVYRLQVRQLARSQHAVRQVTQRSASSMMILVYSVRWPGNRASQQLRLHPGSRPGFLISCATRVPIAWWPGCVENSLLTGNPQQAVNLLHLDQGIPGGCPWRQQRRHGVIDHDLVHADTQMRLALGERMRRAQGLSDHFHRFITGYINKDVFQELTDRGREDCRPAASRPPG